MIPHYYYFLRRLYRCFLRLVGLLQILLPPGEQTIIDDVHGLQAAASYDFLTIVTLTDGVPLSTNVSIKSFISYICT